MSGANSASYGQLMKIDLEGAMTLPAPGAAGTMTDALVAEGREVYSPDFRLAATPSM
jgi:hypothetical protein